MPTLLVKKEKSLRRALTFDALVEKIRETLAAGRARAELAVDRERARTYWETGRFIHIYLLKGEDRAKYGEKIFLHLSNKTGISESLLGEIHLFYQKVPISYARRKLPGWTSCR